MDTLEAKIERKEKIQYWQRLVILFCLGWTVIWINRTVLNPVLPEIMSELNIKSEASAGLISSLFFLPYTVLQVPSGYLGDKFGRKLILVPGLILFGCGAILSGLAVTFTMFLAARVLTGIGQGSYFGPVYSLTAETIPKEKRGLSTAIINSGSALGMAIGLIGSSYLVKEVQIDWRILLFISGALGIVTALLFKKYIKSTPPIAKNNSNKTNVGEDEKVSILTILKNPKMIGTCVLYFATCYGYYMIVTWLPAFLEQERGFEGAAIGIVSSLVAFTSVPGALIFSRVSDKFMNKKVALIIFLEVIGAITLYATVVVNSNELLIVCLVLYGLFGKLAVDPILVSYVADIADPKVLTTTFGLFNFFGMSASVAAPYITGMISDATGTKISGFYLSAIIILVGIVTMLICNMNWKNRKIETS
ncbi:MFS transporter [Clostridium senegalense]|uniref:MFS transporter n=1 Tax=Clostridium senegalense TaxID=1465809 RepID=A0A6M0H221_9CLOT|nr:MFS transporter [Clostridium senegalense]NEU04639.1 MFS transporter [Clostridium senegalense]